ncbi:MAG: ACT domain-containing protein [Coriobacteriia bacterium]|nr:ACT domain-containing protein [Coriobacteriia bacterium]
MSNNCVLSILGKDRSGIVHAASKVLAEANANILDLTQTLLGDLFTMTIIFNIDNATQSFEEIQEGLKAVGEQMNLQVTVQREDIFNFMYSL